MRWKTLPRLALSEAQREHLRRGLPVAGWAGLRLYGDGTGVPFSTRPQRRWSWWMSALPPLLAAIALALLLVRRRRGQGRIRRDDSGTELESAP